MTNTKLRFQILTSRNIITYLGCDTSININISGNYYLKNNFNIRTAQPAIQTDIFYSIQDGAFKTGQTNFTFYFLLIVCFTSFKGK